MQQSQFVSIKPNSDLIRKHIAYYYFHHAPEKAAKESFVYYPHYKNALTVYRHSKIVYAPDYSCSIPDSATEFSVLYSGVQTQPRLTTMETPFQKIGIVFQPLGINHFLDIPLEDALSTSSDKTFQHLGDDFLQICRQVYDQHDIPQKVALLDGYFTAIYTGFNEPLLSDAITLLIDSEKQTVQSLAEILRINRRTLLRLFRKHLGCSVKNYIKIIQFRKTLSDYLPERRTQSLTELAHQNAYYDQSELVHHFKQLTGYNPSLFFKRIKHLGHEDTFWNLTDL